MLEIKEQIKTKKLRTIIRNQCSHVNTEENKYYDYDRNEYEAIYKDCGKTLFYGNYFQLKAFKEDNRK